mmetsp:Transcript_113372/g.321197  ORF Transcript_113372/g.321197 Transcript_113372/m.321197 type:complete len:83 (-) Transcript_113372:77-325(-)
MQSWFPRGLETVLEKGASPEFEILAGGSLLCSEYLDKAGPEVQRSVRQGLRAQLPPGALPASTGSMGPVRQARAPSCGARAS